MTKAESQSWERALALHDSIVKQLEAEERISFCPECGQLEHKLPGHCPASPK